MYSDLKNELEKSYSIVQWNPSKEQLKKIAIYIQSNPDNLNDVSSYIGELCDDVLLGLCEGLDNSDLNYLIALAKKSLEEAE
jgi:hypothetical protein